MEQAFPSKKTKLRSSILATAALIVKSALHSHFQSPVTNYIKYESKTRGRIAVSCPIESLQDSDLDQVQNRVNQIIEQGHPVNVLSLDRAEAELRFTENPVNGQFIYEKIAPPPSVTKLYIAMIPGLTVSSSESDQFLSTTRQVGFIKIVRLNHRKNKDEIESCFDIVLQQESPDDHLGADSTSVISNKNDQGIHDLSHGLFDIFCQSLSKVHQVDLEPSQWQEVERKCQLKAQVLLNAFKNDHYAAGFSAGLSRLGQ